MSMTRNDALTQLAAGLRKFDGFTAAQVLAAEWPGLNGLHAKDLTYFNDHGEKPVEDVARACLGRSLARTVDPLSPSKKMGRPPGPALPPERQTKPRSVRLTDARWEKLKRLGSDWLAGEIDRARL
jgi:hypothetical protein